MVEGYKTTTGLDEKLSIPKQIVGAIKEAARYKLQGARKDFEPHKFAYKQLLQTGFTNKDVNDATLLEAYKIAKTTGGNDDTLVNIYLDLVQQFFGSDFANPLLTLKFAEKNKTPEKNNTAEEAQESVAFVAPTHPEEIKRRIDQLEEQFNSILSQRLGGGIALVEDLIKFNDGLKSEFEIIIAAIKERVEQKAISEQEKNLSIQELNDFRNFGRKVHAKIQEEKIHAAEIETQFSLG